MIHVLFFHHRAKTTCLFTECWQNEDQHKMPYKTWAFLADDTAAHSMMGSWHNIVMSVCLSVSDAMHCGTHGQCRGLKLVPLCS